MIPPRRRIAKDIQDVQKIYSALRSDHVVRLTITADVNGTSYTFVRARYWKPSIPFDLVTAVATELAGEVGTLRDELTKEVLREGDE